MTFDFREAIVKNWPIKLTAFALSGVLWAAVAAREPTTQLVPITLNIETPPGRVLTQRAPEVQALVTGTARDMFKLYASRPVINKLVPETRAASHTLDLSIQDINHTTDVSVTVQDIRPRQIEIFMDTVAQRWVPVQLRVTVIPDNGFELVGGLASEPDSILISGPRSLVRDIAFIPTVSDTLIGARESFTQSVPLDTAGLRVVEPSVRDVSIVATITQIATRVLSNVPVTVAGRAGTWETDATTVLVTVEGPADRVARLTADSIAVTARPSGTADTLTVRLAVRVPLGISGWSTPDSVIVRRRGDA